MCGEETGAARAAAHRMKADYASHAGHPPQRQTSPKENRKLVREHVARLATQKSDISKTTYIVRMLPPSAAHTVHHKRSINSFADMRLPGDTIERLSCSKQTRRLPRSTKQGSACRPTPRPWSHRPASSSLFHMSSPAPPLHEMEACAPGSRRRPAMRSRIHNREIVTSNLVPVKS